MALSGLNMRMPLLALLDMLKITSCLLLLVGSVFAADDAPKLAPGDQAALDKAVVGNLADASKAYSAYLTPHTFQL